MRKKIEAAIQRTMVPGPAWAAAEIQRMLTMQAAQKSVRSRTPSSRRSFRALLVSDFRLGGVEAIWEMGDPLPGPAGLGLSANIT